MKRGAQLLVVVFLMNGGSAFAQGDSTRWAFDTEANFYFFEGGDRIFIPIFKADRGWLHTEARFNYEDHHTFSGWFGYNFRGGQKLEYDMKPMLGVLSGQTNGAALGYETTLTIGKFELYWEAEYVKDFSSLENNFFYSWSDFSFSPSDWWFIGLSGQRTRLYQTELDFQKGFFVGASKNMWEFTVFCYNLGFAAEPFVLFTLAAEF